MNIRKILREHCPNIPIVHRLLSKLKLQEVNRYVMQPADVLSGESTGQKQIVNKYMKLWPDYTQMLEEKLDEYISRCRSVGDRTDIEELREKVLFACFAYGFMPDEFFAYCLENKSPEERRTYISARDLNNYVYQLNDIVDIDIFWDKYKCYEKFKAYYKRDAICIEAPSDYDAFCDFIKKHPVFVAKNVRLSKGDSVELIDSTACGKTSLELFESFLEGEDNP